MSGKCLAHGESFHKWISTFRMPNIWKTFLSIFTCQDISSGLCVYDWPAIALPAFVKQCGNIALRSAVGRWLLASSTWNPEGRFWVWAGHQAFWFNYDYKLHSSFLGVPALPPQGIKCRKCVIVYYGEHQAMGTVLPRAPMLVANYVLQCAKTKSMHGLEQRSHCLVSSAVFSSSAKGKSI